MCLLAFGFKEVIILPVTLVCHDSNVMLASIVCCTLRSSRMLCVCVCIEKERCFSMNTTLGPSLVWENFARLLNASADFVLNKGSFIFSLHLTTCTAATTTNLLKTRYSVVSGQMCVKRSACSELLNIPWKVMYQRHIFCYLYLPAYLAMCTFPM